MAPSRFGIVMGLVPLLTRLEGSKLVAAFAATRYNPAALLNSVGGSSCSDRRATSTSSASARGSAATGSSTSIRTSSEATFQRRWPRAITGNAAGGWRKAAPRACSTFSDDDGGNTGPALPPVPPPGLSMHDAREALKSLFGHDDFRDGQVCGSVWNGMGIDPVKWDGHLDGSVVEGPFGRQCWHI